MNIFVTDCCPIKSAKFLDSKRVIKMTLESAQMLSTNMHVLGLEGAPYRKTHQNHPATVWARTSRSNYLWLVEHFKALSDEYTARYGRVHKSFEHYDTFLKAAEHLQEGPLTPFVNCTTHPDEPDVFVAYKKHLQDKWDSSKIK